MRRIDCLLSSLTCGRHDGHQLGRTQHRLHLPPLRFDQIRLEKKYGCDSYVGRFSFLYGGGLACETTTAGDLRDARLV